MPKLTALIMCFAIAFLQGRAQNPYDTFPKPTLQHAGDVYNEFIYKQSRLYNGIEHAGYSIKIQGHAYFHQREMQTGTIVYDELEYANVPMLYDLFKDQVIVLHFNQFNLLGLVSEKVKEFTLFNHHFIRLQIDSTSGSPLYTGFYDELYKGQLTVLCKRIKKIEETIKDEVERKFIEPDLYFINKEHTYYAIKNYKHLIAALQNKAKEIKLYLRKNKIKFRKDPENAIVKAVAYYDSINK
jgi:hypothetical protein